MLNRISLDEESVKLQVQAIVKKESKHFATHLEELSFLLNTIDLTTLEGNDNKQTITDLCNRALSFRDQGFPDVAAVCVYPVFVNQAVKLLKTSGIKVASVAGAFPSGQSPLNIKISEILYAINEGADEIDMVISRGKFLEGDINQVSDEIYSIKELCGDVHLKVILETGELVNNENIYKASMVALEAGADFIKTSTGKIAKAATLEASFVMLHAISDFYKKTNKVCGFKPAGGIVTPNQAVEYCRLVESILGPQWLTNSLFRVGASRLAGNLVNEIIKQK